MDQKNHSYTSLFIISLPSMAALVLEPLAAMVDTAIVGQISTQWLAALALALNILTGSIWVFNFLVVGVNARLAQSLGSNDAESAAHHIRLALVVALVLGICLGVLLAIFRPFLLIQVMGADEKLVDLVTPYYVTRCLGMPLVLLTMTVGGILRGLQKMRDTMIIAGLVTIINGILTSVLLLVFEFPLEAAAWGTVLAYGCALCFGLWRMGPHLPRLRGRSFIMFRSTQVFAFGRDSLNILTRSGTLSLAFFLAATFATRVGTETIAAHQIGLQIWLFVSYFIDGFAVTATSLGGHVLGRGDHFRFLQLNRRLLVIGVASGVITMLIFLGAKRPLIGVFTEDPKLLHLLSQIWWIIALSQPLNAAVYVFDGIFYGLGAFTFMRNLMLVSFLIFLSIAPFGASLTSIWYGLLAMNGMRLIWQSSRFWWLHGQPALRTNEER